MGSITEMDPRVEEPPPLMAIEAAVSYLQTRIGDLAKHCNGPDCLAPYFIAEKRWAKVLLRKVCCSRHAGS